MRKVYTEVGPQTPAEKMTSWFYARFIRIMFSIAACVFIWYGVDYMIDFANFVQAGGESGNKFYDPPQNVLLLTKLVTGSIVSFFIVRS
jgi:hypothetical protein